MHSTVTCCNTTHCVHSTVTCSPQFNLMSNVFVHEFLSFYFGDGPKYTNSCTFLRISLPPFMSVSVLHSVQHNWVSIYTTYSIWFFPPTNSHHQHTPAADVSRSLQTPVLPIAGTFVMTHYKVQEQLRQSIS